MNYTIISTAGLRLFGQAYGTGTYSCANYDQGCNQATSPLAPLTGFFRDQPPTIVIPVLLVAAVLVAALSILTTKLIRKLRHHA